jgi:hypothetical protein
MRDRELGGRRWRLGMDRVPGAPRALKSDRAVAAGAG